MSFAERPYLEARFRADTTFNEPFHVLLRSIGGPRYATTSVDWLRAYTPATYAMKKAKNFWLKVHKYNPAREAIRQQYPEECEFIRIKLWKKRSMNSARTTINTELNYTGRPLTQAPEAFSGLPYYAQLEPNDRNCITLSKALKYFLSVLVNCLEIWQPDK